MSERDAAHKCMAYEKGGRYFNHENEERGSILLRSAFMYCFGWHMRNRGLPQLAQWHEHTPDITTHAQLELSQPATPRITWIGHATFLVQLGSYNILTDPVFDDLTLLFRRLQKPGIARTELPRIDAIVISHNHRDHMERSTLQYFAQKYPACVFLVPQGDKQWLHKWGIANVVERMWWQDYSVQKNDDLLKFTFLPAHHWSQRSLFDMNKSLWGSWMLEYGPTRIYFAGDTAYSKHFGAIAQEFSQIDCVLMPIGPCEPHEWMKKSHINAEEAGKAFLELNSKLMIPMHWGTYKFGMDRPMVPMERLLAWWELEQQAVKHTTLAPLKIGQSIIL